MVQLQLRISTTELDKAKSTQMAMRKTTELNNTGNYLPGPMSCAMISLFFMLWPAIVLVGRVASDVASRTGATQFVRIWQIAK